MTDTTTTEAALRRLYHEAAALVRDLETAANGAATGLAQADKFISVLNAHVGPLRAAVADVEFFDRAESIVAGMRVIGPLDGVAGGEHG